MTTAHQILDDGECVAFLKALKLDHLIDEMPKALAGGSVVHRSTYSPSKQAGIFIVYFGGEAGWAITVFEAKSERRYERVLRRMVENLKVTCGGMEVKRRPPPINTTITCYAVQSPSPEPRCKCGQSLQYYGTVGGYSVRCVKCNERNAARQREARAKQKEQRS